MSDRGGRAAVNAAGLLWPGFTKRVSEKSVYLPGGTARRPRRKTYAGDIVVVAAGAANSARILLRSVSDQHPAGLANGCD